MMNKKLKIQHLLKLFVALAMYSCSNGQTPTTYHIGKIPQLERFETLTAQKVVGTNLLEEIEKALPEASLKVARLLDEILPQTRQKESDFDIEEFV